MLGRGGAHVTPTVLALNAFMMLPFLFHLVCGAFAAGCLTLRRRCCQGLMGVRTLLQVCAPRLRHPFSFLAMRCLYCVCWAAGPVDPRAQSPRPNLMDSGEPDEVRACPARPAGHTQGMHI